jgi:hypothetical protein
MNVSKSEVNDLKTAPVDVVNEDDTQHSTSEIYIDPVQEASVLRKFDKIVLPQCFIFLLLNYLDRSNIGMFHSSQALIRTDRYIR